MSSGHTAPPRQETVYDGPEIDLFKPRHLRQQSDSKVPTTETVHDGDIPEFITRKFKLADIPQPVTSETVYHGTIPEMFLKLGRIAQDIVMPDRETIYEGPEIASRAAGANLAHANEEGAPQTETVYDETKFQPKRMDTTACRNLVTRLVQRASVRFFAVAFMSLVEVFVCRENLAISLASGLMCLTFACVGFYTYKLNLKALLIATGLYAATTIFMLGMAMYRGQLFLVLVPLLSRGFMIYNLLRTYGLLVDLHLLEAEL
ncbi:MAG TPA: hypothetical protein VFQ00_06285 [Terriglobales bacterium]|nr:hypothetical protein [Terriglobales bacterium]